MNNLDKKRKEEMSPKERRKNFEKLVSVDMYGRKFSGFGEAKPVFCFKCKKRAYRATYKDHHWYCEECV